MNTSAAKVTLLELLARYIERIKASVQPYVNNIKVRRDRLIPVQYPSVNRMIRDV
jgi:hypothetical protein